MLTVVLSLLAGAMQSDAEPQISYQRLGENRFELRLVSSAISGEVEAQAALISTAMRLCGAQPPQFGRYRWEALERLESSAAARTLVSMAFIQDLRCGHAEVESMDQPAVPDPNWQPSASDERAVLAAAEAYFAARDSGRYAEAHAMHTSAMRELSPLADYSAQVRQFNERAGERRGRRVTQLTWYNNPPQAPVPGIYAATDYTGDFANLYFVCGYIIWVLQPDGSWRLVREETALLARADAPNATGEDVARLRSQMRCRD